MTKEKICGPGAKVKLHYTGTLDDGSQFDSSKGRDPLVVEMGTNQLIPGFETALEGLKVGDIKKFSIPPAEAYGEHSKELVKDVDRQHFPKDLNIEVGSQIQLGEGNEMTIATITSLNKEKVTLDVNHPLAGKTLNFEVEVVDII